MKSHLQHTVRPLLLASCALLAILAGCARSHSAGSARSGVSVPVQASAAQQYRYALEYRTAKNLAFIADQERFLKDREVVYQTFARVLEYFPDDRKFTPLARLEMAEMDAGLDYPPEKGLRKGVPIGKHQIHAAIGTMEKLAKDFPEYEYIQAKTLYDRGLCHKRLGEYPAAQESFKQVRDRFSKSSNREIANLAKRSAMFYNETYVNE